MDVSGNLGVMTFGGVRHGGWVLADETIIDQVQEAYESELQSVDATSLSSHELSEAALGTALRHLDLPREQLVVVSKVSGAQVSAAQDKDAFVSHFGLYRKHIFRSVKRTLRRLQLEYIDVLQFDGFDLNAPLAETAQALHDIVQAGLVRYVEVSGTYPWQSRAMKKYVHANHLTAAISFPAHGLYLGGTLLDESSDTESSLSSSPGPTESIHVLAKTVA